MEQLGESAENHTIRIRTRDLPVMNPALYELVRDLLKSTATATPSRRGLGDTVTEIGTDTAAQLRRK